MPFVILYTNLSIYTIGVIAMANLDRIERQIEAAQARAEKARKNADDKNKHVQQLLAKREAAEARDLLKVMKGERAADTRRKILKGVCLDRLIERGTISKSAVDAELAALLDRDHDRKLFGLPPLPQKPQKPQKPETPTSESESEDRAGTNLINEMRRI